MWTPERPLKELGEEVRPLFIEHAEHLYADLSTNKLEVLLKEAPEPRHAVHMVRKAVNHSPDWYLALLKSKPNLKRSESLISLQRIIDGEDHPLTYIMDKNHPLLEKRARFVYDAIYRNQIYQDLIKGFYVGGDLVQPNDTVRKYFGLPPLCISTRRLEEEEEVPF